MAWDLDIDPSLNNSILLQEIGVLYRIYVHNETSYRTFVDNIF